MRLQHPSCQAWLAEIECCLVQTPHQKVLVPSIQHILSLGSCPVSVLFAAQCFKVSLMI